MKFYYNLEDFFKAKIHNYKINAAIFNLMEAHTSTEFTDPKIVIDNRVTLLEFLTNKAVDKSAVQDQVMEEYLAIHSPIAPRQENRATATDQPSTLLTQLQGTTYEFR